jgi:CRP/FNR family transcriptional regulator, cyclic AMP receptor protein
MTNPLENDNASGTNPMGAWVIEAARLSDCPLHRTGDRLLVRPPALHHAGGGCCLVPFLKLRTLLREGKEGKVRCAWGTCNGVWKATREADSDADTELDPATLESDLENKPFLLQLPQAVSLALLNAGQRQDLPVGRTVLADGQVNNDLYLVVQGVLEVMEGDMRVAIIQRGDCFGELSILTRQPVSNSVRSTTPCTLVAVPRDRFHELLGRFGALGTLMNRLLAKRLRASNQQLESILRPGIWGNLEAFPFLSVVQSIQAGQMTGLLTITRSHGRAVFGFDKGKLRHAQCGGVEGEDALLEIFRWSTGIFRFQDDPMQLEVNVHRETMAALLDSLRKFDEIILHESTSLASTALDSVSPSLSETPWDTQNATTTPDDSITVEYEGDADDTSEFDLGQIGSSFKP